LRKPLLLTTLFGTRRNIPRIPDPILGPHVRLRAGISLADDITVLRPACPLGDEDPPNLFVRVGAYDFPSVVNAVTQKTEVSKNSENS
jgi:hypothetical protein